MTKRRDNQPGGRTGPLSQRETPETERPGIFAPPNGDGPAHAA